MGWSDFKQLLNEWHPIKNGNLKPQDFSIGSHKKAWWQCSKAADHEWVSEIRGRTKRSIEYACISDG